MSAGCRRAAFNVQAPSCGSVTSSTDRGLLVDRHQSESYGIQTRTCPLPAVRALCRPLRPDPLACDGRRPARGRRLATAKGYLNDVIVSPNLTSVRVTRVASGWVKTRAAKR